MVSDKKSFVDSLNSFQVIEWTRFCDGQSSKGNNLTSIRVMVLHSAYHLMLIDIYMKFQVIEQTRFYDGLSSKGNNSKSIKARVMVVALCTSSNID